MEMWNSKYILFSASILLALFAPLFLSMTGFVTFEGVTPSAGSAISSTSVTVNATVPQASWLESFIYTWSGTNYTILDDSLILMMNFDNVSGIGEDNNNIVDLSGNFHNGTVSGATFIPTGKYSGAFSFDGNESVTISSSTDFDVDEFTISAWVNLNKTGVTDISAGWSHTCALPASGEIYCWGRNDEGQLGDGTTADRSIPLTISGSYNFSFISMDLYNSCGLLHNGTALCWGDNTYGQIGDGSTTQRNAPTPVSGNHNFSLIEAGWYHTCGLLHNGTALCWGRNNNGQLGNGSVGGISDIPIAVSGNYNFSWIGGSETHTCGLLHNGTALCWGSTAEGTLGIGVATGRRSLPTAVNGSHNFSLLSIREDGGCGLLHNGSALCWGENYFGECGTGVAGEDESLWSPEFVSGNHIFSTLSAKLKHNTCGILQNGSVLCWGHNSYGQVGDGTTIHRYSPVFINSSYEFTLIETGHHTCGITTLDEIYCWGDNSEGQLGDPVPSTRNVPFATYGSNNFSSIDVGFYSTCGILTDDSGLCWGRNQLGQLGDNDTINKNIPTPIVGTYNFSYLDAGVDLGCGLLKNGSTLCWGQNNYGQLGTGSVGGESHAPVLVSGNHNFSQIRASVSYACGLLHNGSVMCWGRNQLGQLGNGSIGGNSDTPIYVSGNHNFSTISSNYNTCGLLHNGTALCWGYNEYGQIGDNSKTNRPDPTPVSGGHNFSQISPGYRFTCGILHNGSAMCWGDNDYGELGNGSAGDSLVPIYSMTDYTFSQIATGMRFTCGLLENGSVICWGYNAFGQLGDKTYTDNLNEVFAYGDYNFSSIHTGFRFTCGILQDGSTMCWGDHSYGQLGIGSFSELFVPLTKGLLFGKSGSSYALYSTFGGSVKGYVESLMMSSSLNSGWNHLGFVYRNGPADLYVNGESSNSFSRSIFLQESLVDLKIGENVSGEIDELRMYNRSLSASEITQLYRSNLRKLNSTDWNFESTHTSLSDASYTFAVHAEDSQGNKTSASRTFTVDAVPDQTPDTSTYRGTSSSYTIVEKVKEKWTHTYDESNMGITEKESVTVVLQKNERLKLNFTGAVHYIGITDMNESTAQVNISFADEEITITTGQSVTFDLNKDGVDDIEVTAGEPGDDGMQITVSYIQDRQLSEEVEEPEPEVVAVQALPTEEPTPQPLDPSLVGAAIAIAAAVIGGAFYKERGKPKKKAKAKKKTKTSK